MQRLVVLQSKKKKKTEKGEQIACSSYCRCVKPTKKKKKKRERKKNKNREAAERGQQQ